jgi:predicted transposase YdaD
MSHQKYEWDVASRMADARKEGEARGHHEGALQVARTALSKGMDVGTIRDITGLDAETIRRLQEN